MISFSGRRRPPRDDGGIEHSEFTITEFPYWEHDANILTLAYPKNTTGEVPWVMNIPGGGWIKSSQWPSKNVLDAFAGRGIGVITVKYRTSDQAKWPAQLADTQQALAWAVDSLEVSPTKWAVMGGSAGGLMAAWMGVTSSPRAVALWASPVDFVSFTNEEIRHLLGRQDRKAASPVYKVTALYPPTRIDHGKQDQTVPYDQAQIMRDTLMGYNVPLSFNAYPDKGHMDRDLAIDTAVANFIEGKVNG